MFYVRGPSWEVPIADKVISWLETAARLDPEAEQYRRDLATVRANKDQINRMKLETNAREKARSREFAQKMFGQRPTHNRDRGEEIYGAIVGGLWELAIDDLRQESEVVADAFRDVVGCPSCWGTRVHGLLSNKPCWTCGGTGKR